MKTNLLFCDCPKNEVESFRLSIEKTLKETTIIQSSINNKGQGNFILKGKRYINMFLFPFKIFLKRKQYNRIFGWQQFYATNLSFFSRLFHIKKENELIIVNFTYKEKAGFIGFIYKKYMKFSLESKYVDYIHIPSYNYIDFCRKHLDIPRNKFIVTSFGIPETFKEWENRPIDISNYSLSIGRSNRDFDFLVRLWSSPYLNSEKLIIISDTYKPKHHLPNNITLYNNITGNRSFPYIKNCKLMIIPIDNGNICSGDTVLLTGLMFHKAVVITQPSTLAEMYIDNNINGICIDKENLTDNAQKIRELLNDEEKLKLLGENGYIKFANNFSRFAMGEKLCSQIIEKSKS